MASYTFREFPVDQALEMTKRLGLKRITFKDFHLKMDATPAVIAETVAKVKAAGLELYAGGVIYMKSEAEVDRAFDYAKAAGMGMIIGVPNYELLDLHQQEGPGSTTSASPSTITGPDNPLYPTPAERLRADRDARQAPRPVHRRRAHPALGCRSVRVGREVRRPPLDVHIKDVSAATAQGTTVEIGRGVIDIPKFLRTLRSTTRARWRSSTRRTTRTRCPARPSRSATSAA